MSEGDSHDQEDPASQRHAPRDREPPGPGEQGSEVLHRRGKDGARGLTICSDSATNSG